MKRALLVCVALIIGCGGGKKEKEFTVIPIEQAPAGWLEKAQKELPDVTFDTCRKLPNGNLELRGKGKNGKVREVEFKPSGEIEEIE